MMVKFKIQNSKFKINPNVKYQIKELKFCRLISLCFLVYFGFSVLSFTIHSSYAQEVTLVYTADTHAMLYPCSCPIQRDGGIARRATLIKQIKKNKTPVILLDAGRFFAAGAMDEYSQNPSLDMERTRINLKGMELMGYDALGISEDEFNFGKEFLQENINKIKIPFLACNIEPLLGIKPYLIKEIKGIKFGIIALVSLSASQKVQGINFIEPKIALEKIKEELKRQGVDIIILLSSLEEDQSRKLIKEVEGIDILILSRSHTKGDYFDRLQNTLILKPAWQGRRLGRATLTLKDKKIINYEVNEIRLSEQIKDDPEILNILPACFSDINCHKEGFIATCKDPGIKSQCIFTKPAQILLKVILPKSCRVCSTEAVIEFLKRQFPGLVVNYLYYPDEETKKIINDLEINTLPVYLFGKEIEKEKNFDKIKNNFEIKNNFYMLKTEISGIAYFLGRERIEDRLDLFISLYDKETADILSIVKEFNPQIHFLAIELNNRFDAAAGNLEVEEDLRALCIKKYYPGYFWQYISCRSQYPQTSWWEKCVEGLDTQEIRHCALSEEGRQLLRENIKLNKELKIISGPTYLLENQEIFSSKGAPDKEELRSIIKKGRR